MSDQQKKSIITFEVTRQQKASYVRAAKPGKLREWALKILDKAAKETGPEN